MATKIVQDESRIKRKASGFSFFIPSRSLSSAKIVQGESRIKREASGFSFFMPSRSLSSAKLLYFPEMPVGVAQKALQ